MPTEKFITEGSVTEARADNARSVRAFGLTLAVGLGFAFGGGAYIGTDSPLDAVRIGGSVAGFVSLAAELLVRFVVNPRVPDNLAPKRLEGQARPN